MCAIYSLYNKSVLRKPLSASFQYMLTPEYTAQIAASAAITSAGFNSRLDSYLQYSQIQQELLLQRTTQHMNDVRSKFTNPSASLLRDKNTWPDVKKLVLREELMKAQITGKLDLPVFGSDEREFLSLIQNRDLAKLDDPVVDRIIKKMMKTDEEAYLGALSQFKETGQTNPLLQESKLSELSRTLQDIDLKHISRDQYKNLLENYCERPEFHHRESISSNPEKQSLADNIDVLDTTAHDRKHIDPETGKISYRKPVSEEPINRTKEMVSGNKKRVLRNDLLGLSTAVLIGAGIGFTMNFIAEMARVGLENEQIGNFVFDSIGTGLESGIAAGITYIAGRGLTAALEKLGLDIASNMGSVIQFGAVGVLSTAIICTYQYVKARVGGANTEEALYAIRKPTIVSLSLLAVSLVAQGVWGGPAGILVSTGIGLLYFSLEVQKTIHSRHLEQKIREYTIEEYRRLIDRKQIIYIQ